MIRVILLLVLWCFPPASIAQAVGSCARSEAEAFLDVGNVRARILNNGALFWRGSNNRRGPSIPHVYEVPKGEGVQALFNTNILIGGIVRDTLRFAGSSYGPYEFWPGPIPADGAPPDSLACRAHDRIYEIAQSDFEAFDRTGEPTANLRLWPAHLGAPVVDGDGVPGNYDLAGGDRPELLGNQRLWWVMNDLGNTHDRTYGLPLGMEVHVSAFAFDVQGAVGLSTFYHYTLIYKGTSPLEDAYFGLFVDPELGSSDDNYIGVDTLLHLGYIYNADNDDEGEEGYGSAPPALGFAFLPRALAPTALPLALTTFANPSGGKGGVTGYPGHDDEFYNYMQGRWFNGQPFTVGGDGGGFSDIPTRFIYPGDPVTRSFWSELNLDGKGKIGWISSRKMMQATGPFTMQPGEKREVAFAIIWSRGADHLDSVRKLREDTAFIQERAEILYSPRDLFLPTPSSPAPPDLAVSQNHPNPFTDRTVIRYSLPQTMQVRLTVYDVLGREVAQLVEKEQEAGTYAVPFDGTGLPAGLYLYRIQLDHHTATRTMLRVP